MSKQFKDDDRIDPPSTATLCVLIKRYGTKRIIDAVWNIHCELEAKAKAVRGRQKKKTLDAWAVVEQTRIPVVLASRCARRGTRTARAHPSPRGAEEQDTSGVAWTPSRTARPSSPE